MEYNDSTTGEANEELAKRLAKDRSDWKLKISNLVGLLKEVRDLRGFHMIFVKNVRNEML